MSNVGVRALAAAVAAATLCACAAFLGIDEPELRNDGPDAEPPPVTVDSGDGGAPPVDAAEPLREVDKVKGIFVNIRVGTDGPTCGDLAAPCRSIQAGIDVFANGGQAAGKTIVYVASASYDETITLASGVTVEGGVLGMSRTAQ